MVVCFVSLWQSSAQKQASNDGSEFRVSAGGDRHGGKLCAKLCAVSGAFHDVPSQQSYDGRRGGRSTVASHGSGNVGSEIHYHDWWYAVYSFDNGQSSSKIGTDAQKSRRSETTSGPGSERFLWSKEEQATSRNHCLNGSSFSE